MLRIMAGVVMLLLLIPVASIIHDFAKRNVRGSIAETRASGSALKPSKAAAKMKQRNTSRRASNQTAADQSDVGISDASSEADSKQNSAALSPQAGSRTEQQPAGASSSPSPASCRNQEAGIIERLTDLARSLKLSVEFHESVKDQPCETEPRGSSAQQFDAILMRYGLTWTEMPQGGILVFSVAQGKLFDQFVVKPVRVSNSAEVLAEELQALLGGEDSGRSVRASKEPNTVMIKAPAREMNQIVTLIRALDQNPAEALVEIEVWSISREVQTELGTQMATTYNLPALLQGNVLRLLVLPASSANLLHSSGSSKLVASAKLQVQHNKKSACRFSRNSGGSVTYYGSGNDAAAPFYSGESGIGIEILARIKEEQTDLQLILNAAGGSGQFQSLSTSATIPDQRSVILARATFDYNTDLRRGLFPFSLLPIIGRVFSLPKIDKGSASLVVTVKSTITRSPIEVPDGFRFNRVRSITEYISPGNESQSSASRLRRIIN